MAIDLYYLTDSPPCVAIILAAKELGIQLNLIHVDLEKGEHLRPEFVKLNPQHTVPTLVDGDHVLWESRAILAYLAEKYGKTDALYPKDPAQRSVVNQRLFFDLGTFYQRFAAYYYPFVFESKPVNEELFKPLGEAFEFLEIFLEGRKWVAGDELTVADLSLFASVLAYEVAEYDFSGYKNVSRWLEVAKKRVAGYEEVKPNYALLKKYFDAVKK